VENEKSVRHDVLTNVGTIGVFIDLVEGGFDFTTVEGREVLEDARNALKRIEAMLVKPVPSKTST
jgi:hypothetical protein